MACLLQSAHAAQATVAGVPLARGKRRRERALHARDVGLQPREQAERLGRLVHAHAARPSARARRRARGLDQLGLERRVDDVGDPVAARRARRPAPGCPGMPCMPTGVALTTPAAAAIAVGEDVGQPAARRRRSAASRSATSAAARAVSVSWTQQRARRRGPSARRRPRALRRRRRPAPPSCPRRGAPEASSKLRRKPMRSVL